VNPTAILEIPGVYPAGFAVTTVIALVGMAIQAREDIKSYRVELKRHNASGYKYEREPDHPVTPFHIFGGILLAGLVGFVWPAVLLMLLVALVIGGIGFPVMWLLSIGTEPEPGQ
jgi:hypothetical protein